MFRSRLVKIMLVVGFVVSLGLSYSVFGFDLIDEIDSKFQKIYNGSSFDGYGIYPYSSSYSKDPFGDVMKNITDRSNNLRTSGFQYVKRKLEEKGCFLTDKKIGGILYYFVPEFRESMMKHLKMELGEYDNNKYKLSKDDVEKYCREYYTCVGTKTSAPSDMMTRCEEFFKITYEAVKYNELIKQNAYTSQMGADKYWNNTTDDSPYDIMEDLGVLSKLLYQDVEEPITPVFYDIPMFSNSKNNLRKGKDYYSDGEKELDNDGKNENNSDKNSKYSQLNGGEKSNGQNGSNNQSNPGNGGGAGESSVQPIEPSDFVMMDEYDDLVDGLGSMKISGVDSVFSSNLCSTEEDDAETELNNDLTEKDDIYSIDEMSEEDYEEIVDYMLEAVDKFGELSDDVESQIMNNAVNKDEVGLEGESHLRERVEQVKKCTDSCKGLRIDQKASCLVKCACGEISSADIDLFDPNKTPGLGPIFILKVCAVPGVDTRFSVGGKRIHSIEEGLREIYGVVDKLSREGRLGTWTQQYEHLDSSTKQMNFADSFAFTIDVEFVNITNKIPTHSEQFKNRELINMNKTAQSSCEVSNPLNIPSAKNKYIVVETQYMDQELDARPEPLADMSENADANRFVQLEFYWNSLLRQQEEFWGNASKYINNIDLSAETLQTKKCQK